MSLDVTPAVPEGTQLIQAYGDGCFRIAGQHHEGSVIVFGSRTVGWDAAAPADVAIEGLAPVVDVAAETDILIVGCGPEFTAPPQQLRQRLKDHEIVLEWMDTGAACRTFNVLVTEGRRVAAALIAVD